MLNPPEDTGGAPDGWPDDAGGDDSENGLDEPPDAGALPPPVDGAVPFRGITVWLLEPSPAEEPGVLPPVLAGAPVDPADPPLNGLVTVGAVFGL
jgi:hypothetical protein